MNKQTANKIKKNPHYKPSRRQFMEMSKLEDRPMIEFGQVNKHSNSIQKHDTNQKKLKRKKK